MRPLLPIDGRAGLLERAGRGNSWSLCLTVQRNGVASCGIHSSDLRRCESSVLRDVTSERGKDDFETHSSVTNRDRRVPNDSPIVYALAEPLMSWIRP